MKREDFPNRNTFSQLSGGNGYPLAIARQMEKKAKPSDRVKLLVLKNVKQAIANCDAFHRAFAERRIQTIQKQVNEILACILFTFYY
ncbi:hypothetical protein Ple7327_1823 [Pleurocapsa sp. PCC 7327]|uniref:hypothetical protein n=1 Tax=Pleurocapsa sp. PCC 7327 TaxID=118163 RepID=UPI00029FA602|nr:hypothetical protein [Pleurocapsa sp. PCC 7327]AFY77173.1 hypothetical protein Ple7327_1823 [Pleurocapsa sp. PCC 7327]